MGALGEPLTPHLALPVAFGQICLSSGYGVPGPEKNQGVGPWVAGAKPSQPVRSSLRP